MLASLVNWTELLESVVASVVAALLLTFTVSVGIWGATRYIDLNLDNQNAAAYGALAVGALGLLSTIALIVVGLILMVNG